MLGKLLFIRIDGRSARSSVDGDRGDFYDFVGRFAVEDGFAGIGVDEQCVAILGVLKECLVFQFVFIANGSY